MKPHNKQNRHYSNQCGRKFVNDYRGLNYHPTYATEVLIPGKYAQVDVTLNLGSHPLPDLTDISPLEKMKANTDIQRSVRVRTASAPVAPISSELTQEKKRKRISPLGWIAIISGVVGSAVGITFGITAYKKS